MNTRVCESFLHQPKRLANLLVTGLEKGEALHHASGVLPESVAVEFEFRVHILKEVVLTEPVVHRSRHRFEHWNVLRFSEP